MAPPPRPAGPARPALSRDLIEAEALRLIDAEGLEAFSTRRLGQALGCEAMSIYHHFPSKAHLLDALVDRVLATIPIPERTLPAAERLTLLARAWRRMAHAHAGFYPWLALHRWNSEVGVRFLGEWLECLHAAGLDDENAARGLRVLGYYMLGATLDETRGYARGASSLNPISDAELAQRHPAVARAGRWFAAAQFDRTFEVGLAIVLGGLGVRGAVDPPAPAAPGVNRARSNRSRPRRAPRRRSSGRRETPPAPPAR